VGIRYFAGKCAARHENENRTGAGQADERLTHARSKSGPQHFGLRSFLLRHLVEVALYVLDSWPNRLNRFGDLFPRGLESTHPKDDFRGLCDVDDVFVDRGWCFHYAGTFGQLFVDVPKYRMPAE
jgi:hypothetical protein